MSAERRPSPLLVLYAGWLLPGAGHFMLGQRRRAVAFAVSLVATFAIGVAITDGAAVSLPDRSLLSIIAFVAKVCAGLPFLAGLGFHAVHPPAGISPSIPANWIVAAIDLGVVFTMLSGLLNLLLVVDAFERASEPPPGKGGAA